MLADTLRLMRPNQWIKSSFVLVGLIFGHAWKDADILRQVLIAVAAFCLVSSAAYVFNDVADRDADRRHPRKRERPLAAGRVTVGYALGLALLLAVAGIGIGLLAGTRVAALLGCYLVLNLAYSWRLKRVVLLDVFIIGSGFMLRILAGTIGVGIEPSRWLLLCGLMLTLLLGFAKRRSEIATSGDDGNSQRDVLKDYSPALLDKIIGITAANAIITYSLYTMSPETIAVHGTSNLIATIPFVMYAILRYIFLLHARGVGEDPSRELLSDPHIVLSVAGWVAVTLFLIL